MCIRDSGVYWLYPMDLTSYGSIFVWGIAAAIPVSAVYLAVNLIIQPETVRFLWGFLRERRRK